MSTGRRRPRASRCGRSAVAGAAAAALPVNLAADRPSRWPGRSLRSRPTGRRPAQDDPGQRRQDDQGAAAGRGPSTRAGHRVVLVESAKYRLTGHRFSRAVDRFHTVPEAAVDPDYAQRAGCDIVRAEGVDVYVPVCSPAASYYDALAKPACSRRTARCCTATPTWSPAGRQVRVRGRWPPRSGCRCRTPTGSPRPARSRTSTSPTATPPYILKSIPYDPVHRLDLTPLPRPTAAGDRGLRPVQADLAGRPRGSCRRSSRAGSTARTAPCATGGSQVYCCCESSAFQVNYEMVDKPEIEAWVRAVRRRR